jgi:hypothetical protein
VEITYSDRAVFSGIRDTVSSGTFIAQRQQGFFPSACRCPRFDPNRARLASTRRMRRKPPFCSRVYCTKLSRHVEQIWRM